MVLHIELDDRIYRDIESYCKANNLMIQEYVHGMITEKHSLNKYGDLNEMMPLMIDKSMVEAKKRPRQAKEADEVKAEDAVSGANNASATKSGKDGKEEMAAPKTEEKVAMPTVTRKRKLKTL